MKTIIVQLAVVVVFVSIYLACDSEAFPGFLSTVPNGSVNNCMTCHISASGGEGWNEMGKDILRAGGADPDANPSNQNLGYNGQAPNWADVRALDSDGDGQYNGWELGDPCFTWIMGETPDRTTDISLPWILDEYNRQSMKMPIWYGICNAIEIDDDNDGMPDTFENQFSLDPLDPSDADLDSDNDGFVHVAEYIADTNPTNGESFFSIRAISNDVDTLVIFEPNSADRLYTLEFNDSVASNWTADVNNTDVPGTTDSLLRMQTHPMLCEDSIEFRFECRKADSSAYSSG